MARVPDTKTSQQSGESDEGATQDVKTGEIELPRQSTTATATTAGSAPKTRPELRVRGIVISDGEPGFAFMSDGTKLSPGDRLEGGFVVEKIDIDHVVLRSGTQEFIYRVGGK